jgi:succinate dehydrogenase/fumarate reductase cytochrome b subunit
LKYAAVTGIFAAFLLIVFCFLPWAFYPDLQENFTGFYSSHNNYGKPGKAIVFFAVLSIVLFLLPKIWAGWVNQITGVILFAYTIKTYILYSSCYNTICPQIHFALPGVLAAALVVLICGLLSRAKSV